MRRVSRGRWLAGLAALVATLLAGTVWAQTSSSQETGSIPGEPQSASPLDGDQRCLRDAASKLSELLAGADFTRSAGGRFSVKFKNSPPESAVRDILVACPTIRTVRVSGSGAAIRLEEILNAPGVRLVTTASGGLRVEFVQMPERKEPEAQPLPNRQLEQLSSDTTARLEQLSRKIDAKAAQITRDTLGFWFVLFSFTLQFVTIAAIAGLGRLQYTKRSEAAKVLEAMRDELSQLRQELAQLGSRVQRDDARDRGKGGQREATREEDHAARLRQQEQERARRRQEEEARERRLQEEERQRRIAEDQARLRRVAEEERQVRQRYDRVLTTIRGAMPSLTGFEKAQRELVIIALEREVATDPAGGTVLREVKTALDKSTFWGVEFDERFLVFPGRRLYADAGSLAQAGGQAARELFADLFEIKWDADDLTVHQPAIALYDSRDGGFKLERPGALGLFRQGG